MAGFAYLPTAFSGLDRRASARRPKPPRSRFTPYPAGRRAQRRHRTIFISDTHLGTRGCKAEMLADFLASNSCDTLYLIGDIIDGWQLRRRWYWNDAHSQVVSEIL